MENNRIIRDSIFCRMFSEKEYAAQMIETLHPEIVCDMDELEIITNVNVLANGMQNDLGLLYKDNLILLVEAQSTFSPNFILRAGFYVWDSYKLFLQTHHYSLHSTRCIPIPQCEIYVIYTGDDRRYGDTITLSDTYFDGVKQDIEVTANVIYSSDQNNVLGQYILFCKEYSHQYQSIGKDIKKLKLFIDQCIENNILSDFLKHHEGEVMSMLEFLFDEEEARRVIQKEREEDVAEKSLNDGIEQGKVEAFVSMYKEGYIDEKVALEKLSLSKEEFIKLL